MPTKSLVAEAVATFALCFVGGGAILVDAMLGDTGPGLVGIALAHGIILAVGVTATMNISGAHINPAVTVAMLVTGRISGGDALLYILAQLFGGVVAGVLLAYVLFAGVMTPGPESQSVVAAAMNGTPYYDPSVLGGAAMVKAIVIEATLTFLLLFAVFGTAVDPRHPNVGGFGIGLTITALILAAGPLTGASMNPARTFGTGIVTGATFWSQQIVYWIGPIAGAVIAALLYDGLILDKRETKNA